eukprot:TRINITY_DN95351_c0_g1_i1.p1 TRINITY_DN95351_c0_g1~~TRINITY_DN95351_c0_g1_i1.p1  ORF type:complete len:394 (-),score=37.41 TRINITY_DN95351_c0_g1_i1:501-1682(-)
MSREAPRLKCANSQGSYLPCLGFGVGTRAGYACCGPRCFQFDVTRPYSGYRASEKAGAVQENATEQAVFQALQAGVRHLDEAEVYNNEVGTGRGIRKWLAQNPEKNTRSKLFITSKVWQSSCTRELYAGGHGSIESSCRTSLEILGLDYFDLYLVHTPRFLENLTFEGCKGQGKKQSDSTDGEQLHLVGEANELSRLEADALKRVWLAMEALVLDCDPALVRAVGVSNFEEKHLRAILDHGNRTSRLVPAVNQLEVHPHFQRPKLLQFCAEHSIIVSTYGGLKPMTDQRLWAPDWQQEDAGTWYRSRLMKEVIPRIAKAQRRSEAQVLQRWNFQFMSLPPDVSSRNVQKVLITTTRCSKRLQDSLAIFDFELTHEEMEEITKAGQEVDFRGFR